MFYYNQLFWGSPISGNPHIFAEDVWLHPWLSEAFQQLGTLTTLNLASTLVFGKIKVFENALVPWCAHGNFLNPEMLGSTWLGFTIYYE